MSDIFASDNRRSVNPRFIELLESTEREGIHDLIVWLTKETDFFTAPASTKYHGAVEGGLVEHSLTVDLNMERICATYGLQIPGASRRLTALTHDICKANFYKVDYKNAKDPVIDGKQMTGWHRVPYYTIDDQFPVGHGEKSVIILQKFIELTDEEIMAINWHMGFSDDRCKGYGGMQALSNAFGKYPLAVALHMADLASNYFDGV